MIVDCSGYVDPEQPSIVHYLSVRLVSQFQPFRNEATLIRLCFLASADTKIPLVSGLIWTVRICRKFIRLLKWRQFLVSISICKPGTSLHILDQEVDMRPPLQELAFYPQRTPSAHFLGKCVSIVEVLHIIPFLSVLQNLQVSPFRAPLTSKTSSVDISSSFFM